MTDGPTIIRVLIADGDREARSEIRRILDSQPDVDVVGEAATDAELVPMLRTSEADVLVVDMGFRGTQPFAAAEKASSNGNRPRVVVVTQRNDSRYVARALHAGAAGYLLKDRAFEELAEAIRRVAAGSVFISAGIAGIETKS